MPHLCFAPVGTASQQALRGMWPEVSSPSFGFPRLRDVRLPPRAHRQAWLVHALVSEPAFDGLAWKPAELDGPRMEEPLDLVGMQACSRRRPRGKWVDRTPQHLTGVGSTPLLGRRDASLLRALATTNNAFQHEPSLVIIMINYHIWT